MTREVVCGSDRLEKIGGRGVCQLLSTDGCVAVSGRVTRFALALFGSGQSEHRPQPHIED